MGNLKIKELDKNQKNADLMKLIIGVCDSVLPKFDLKQGKEALEKMRDHTSTLEAGSIIGMALGVDVDARTKDFNLKNNTYSAILELLNCRQAQRDNALNSVKQNSSHLELAKQMGFI